MKKLTIEEKEKDYDEAIKKLRGFYRDYDTVSCLIDVKEELANMFPELKESDESRDERIRKNCIHFLELQKQHHAATFEIEECIDWLEKKGEQKPEWSEDDEVGLADAMWAIEQAKTIAKDENDMGNLWYAERWLKSIKDRYTWKPSDEQMEALANALSLAKNCGEEYSFDLRTLYEQLKKLKE